MNLINLKMTWSKLTCLDGRVQYSDTVPVENTNWNTTTTRNRNQRSVSCCSGICTQGQEPLHARTNNSRGAPVLRQATWHPAHHKPRQGVPACRAARLTPHHMAVPVGSAYAPGRLVVPGSPLSAALE